MLEAGNNSELPPIPGKRYFTIGEVSDCVASNRTCCAIGNRNFRS